MDLEEAAVIVYLYQKSQRKNKKRKYWIHPLLQTRHEKGQFATSFEELKKYEDTFFGYVRMSVKSFDELLSVVKNFIKGEDTRFRNSITPEEKLVIVLRFGGHDDEITMDKDIDRYSITGRIGEGAHGLVLKGIHLPTGRKVALKKLLLKSLDEGIPLNVMREIKTLQHINCKYVVQLFDVFPRGMSFILVLEYMSSGLWEMLRDTQNPLMEAQIKTYTQMLLKGVDYMHEHNIMHRDLKPANLLINSQGILKIADLGLARLFWNDSRRPYSHQVATRWYRAPELLYGARFYNQSVDLWAVGCIVAEMINLQPLFPGESDIEQLAIVLHNLGTPTKESWPDLTTLPDYNKITFPESEATPWEELLPNACQEAVAFVRGFLIYDSAKRITANMALTQPWFSEQPLPAPLNKMPKPNESHRVLMRQQSNTNKMG